MTDKKPRGLATLTPERRKEISSMGGKAVPAEKRYYANKANASAAGYKGGKAPRGKRSNDVGN
jgi:general stress protein YciG